MTTARQIRALTRPLLDRHADLALVAGRMVWLKPVAHVAREIWIDRTGRASDFYPKWHLTPMFTPEVTPASSGGWCWDLIRRPLRPGDWNWIDPTVPEDFVRQVEAETLPILRPVDTLEAYVAFARAHREAAMSTGHRWTLVMEIALGNLEAARAWWDKAALGFSMDVPDLTPRERFVRGRYNELGPPLLDGDRAALAAILHRWERENVTGTAAEPIWTPTPFPIEEAI